MKKLIVGIGILFFLGACGMPNCEGTHLTTETTVCKYGHKYVRVLMGEDGISFAPIFDKEGKPEKCK